MRDAPDSGRATSAQKRVGEIGSTEAKTRQLEFLRAVDYGETIVITRHGKRVAHPAPARAGDRASREWAVEPFRQRRASLKPVAFSTEEALAWRHEGHRP